MINQKEELERKISDLEIEIDSWKEEYESLLSDIEAMQEELDNIYLDPENTIFDLNNFRRQLEIHNLMTKELDEFIENYMRFSNQG